LKTQVLRAASEAGTGNPARLEEIVSEAFATDASVVDEVLDSGLVDETGFLKELSNVLSLGWHTHVRPDSADATELKEACPTQIGLKYRFVPLRFVDSAGTNGDGGGGDRKLELVTYDPFSLQQRQAARKEIPYSIRWSLASRRLVLEALQDFYGVGAATFAAILEGRDVDAQAVDLKEEINVLDEDDEEASVVKFVNQIIRQALNQRATDIHVEPLEDDLRIRFRIDGVLKSAPVPENIKTLQSSVIARLKVMARLDIAEKRRPQDGRISLELDGNSIDVRVATIPSVTGESVSLRLLGQEKFTIPKLGLSAELDAKFRQLLEEPNGIVLVTGPTGSGKSTTLYSFLSELNDESRRIVTIEDPVENRLDGVIQIAIKPEIDLTFASGLRSILRGDPNVIMVGEIRDLETSEIAVRSALTGHLVFSTLHTNDAIGGITRLVDMGLEPFLVVSSVRAFIAQRLVRRLCENCRILGGISAAILKSCDLTPEDGERIYRAHPKGCDSCRYTGFHGRLALYELCQMTEELSELVLRQANARELREQAHRDGFRNMREYGILKAFEGATTLEEVVAVA
jgi:general secretion pathway protein E